MSAKRIISLMSFCLIVLVLFLLLTVGGLPAHQNNVYAGSGVSLPPGDIGLPPLEQCQSLGYAGTPYITGINCRLILIDDYPRTYIVYVPENVQQPAPVVFLFHGTNGDGDGYLLKSGWVDKARDQGLILVSASGLKYCHVGYSCEQGGLDGWASKWHHYHLYQDENYNLAVRFPDYPEHSDWPPKDVKFIEAIMDDVSRPTNELPVDTNRFYASGFSSGAAFTARLAIEVADRLAAVGYSSAGLIDVSQPEKPVDLIPVLALIGTHEKGVVQIAYGEGSITPVPLDPDEFLALDDLMSYFVIPHLDGFEHHYAPGNLKPVEILEGSHYTLYRWRTGKTDHIFQLGVLEGLVHTVPNGYDQTKNPVGFVGADIFWDFFQSAPDYPFVPASSLEGDPDRPIIVGWGSSNSFEERKRR